MDYLPFQLEYKLEDMLNELRSAEVATQYTVTQKEGMQRQPPLKIDNKEERPLVRHTLKFHTSPLLRTSFPRIGLFCHSFCVTIVLLMRDHLWDFHYFAF